MRLDAYNHVIMQTKMKQNRTKRNIVLPLAIVGSALLFTTGCGGAIVGDWHMIKAVPNKEMFAIEDALFARDGSFAATVTIEGKTTHEKGTYAFNGFTLTMRPQGGGQRRYKTVMGSKRLKVLDGNRHVILQKTKKSKQK